MDVLIELFTPIQVWHWVALALILLGIEMAIGTYDLLWVSAAAFATAAYMAVIPAPYNGIEGQLIFFGLVSIVLLLLGRTVFSGWRERESDQPLLNRRMETMIGSRALVTQAFAAGTGRVKIGDTEWLAFGVDGEDFAEGATVLVDSVDATAVNVKPA